jgi:hypothetical protein
MDAEFLDPPEIYRARAAVGAVDGVTLGQEQLGKVRAVLPSDPSDDCRFQLKLQSSSEQHIASKSGATKKDSLRKAIGQRGLICDGREIGLLNVKAQHHLIDREFDAILTMRFAH